MNASRSEVVVIDTMAPSALVDARLDPRSADAFRDLSGFIVVQPDDALMQQCARLRFACEQLGHPLAQKLHQADRWIAATAVAGELDLVSNDRVFANTPGLSVLTTRND